jgi:phage-related protein
MKPVVWLGTSKADLKACPATAMDDMGHQLVRVQCGLDPDDGKPMASIRKTTPKTTRWDIDLARQRLARVPRRAPHG